MRLLALLNPLCGLGHAAVVGGILRGVRGVAPSASAVVVSGGPPIPPGLFPADVDAVQLPALLPTEGLFSEIRPRAANLSSSTVRKMRRRMVSALLRTFRPDVVLVEHYPFGRHAFAKELEPLLDEVTARLPEALIISSLSVLGGRAPEHRRAELVADAVRRRFHAVLVHTDPRVELLSDDYPTVAAELAPLVRYTGYVLPRGSATPAPREEVRARLGLLAREKLVVVHAGGGRDGDGVVRLALGAVRALRRPFLGARPRLLVVTGPALPERQAVELEALARGLPGVALERQRPDLFDCVAAADAVVTMAGYATCAELCAARAPAVLVPRRSDGEQVRRALRLERLGYARVLPAEADEAALARVLEALLREVPPAPPALALDLGGATESARALVALAAKEASEPRRALP